jgi:PAS domain S-box-containing protein
MDIQPPSDDRIDALRKRAERVLEVETQEEREQIQRDVASLLEDLRVHQIELKLQNEELRATQHDLETSRERYRELFDTAPTGYVVFDRDGIVQDINQTGADQLSARRKQVVGKPFLLFLQPEYRDLFSHHLGLTLDVEEEQVVEVILQPKNGSTFWARLQSVPFPGSGGGERSVRTAIINISEQKKLEQELIAAREEALQTAQVQRAFLSSMSHEIRTPLTSVIGFADVLDELAADDQQKRIARLIKGSGRRLLSTLNSVLSYARLQEEDDEVDLEPMNVAAIVHESVKLLQPLAEAQGVALVYEAEDEADSYAPVHEEHLDRVLDNLIGNGLKYTDDGTVTVRVRTTDGTVEIDVEDTGVGIDPGMQKMIFEPFFQAGSGLEETRDGIGLGLSITRQLVDSMHGTIRLDSQRGVGTCFTLAFPRTPVPTEDSGSTPRHTNTIGDEAPLRVLLVDDQEDMLDLVRLFLRDVATVERAGTAAEGVTALEEDRFDAVLADIQLGEKETGMEMLHRIRGLAGSHDVPVVAFTAYALPGDRERFERIGFDGYLGKPFTKEDLHATLDAVTG